MKLKKMVFALATFALLLSSVPQISTAQTSFGASYEIRDEEPKNGYGLRIEQDVFQNLPIVNLGLRAHFSYFNEENSVSRNTITYSQDVTSYDYGLALIGGVGVGPISPYAGLGLGASSLSLNRNDLPNNSPLEEESDDSSIYWNGLVGAKIGVLPIQPFVEYRLEDVSDYEDELSDYDSSTGRLIFGVSLSF